MQMAAYRTLPFRPRRSSRIARAFARERGPGSTRVLSLLPPLCWSLPSPYFSIPLSLSLSLCFALLLSPVYTFRIRVYVSARAESHVQLRTRRDRPGRGNGNTSIVRKRESTQFPERPRCNFAVNQVFSVIIRGLRDARA